jgi:two-component system sensor histidine kinase UhpB
LTKRSGIKTLIEIRPPDFPRLAPELEIAIFRVVQEALTNVFRHSGARNAWVVLATNESRTVVMVRDDGKGVAEHIVKFGPGSVGVGIGGMRQRAKEFGGELRLQNSNPGALVEVLIPMSAAVLNNRAVSVADP